MGNNMLLADQALLRNGVYTASSGNAGLALAGNGPIGLEIIEQLPDAGSAGKNRLHREQRKY